MCFLVWVGGAKIGVVFWVFGRGLLEESDGKAEFYVEVKFNRDLLVVFVKVEGGMYAQVNVGA